MLNWAFKQWISQPGRALLAMMVFASVLSLAMLFDGIRLGVEQDMREFPQSLKADLVVVNNGNLYFSFGPTPLPMSVLNKIGAMPQIVDAQPLGVVPFILTYSGKKTPAMLVAYSDKGGPPEIITGRAPHSAQEITIDNNLARLNQLELGDNITVLSGDYTIVGISGGTTSPFTPYVFITYEQFVKATIAMADQGATSNASTANQAQNISLVSFMLLDIEEGADLKKVRNELEETIPGADFFTPAELGAADGKFANRMLGPMLILLSTMAWLITLLTMSMLRHAEVQSNLHQFGIQKALGAKPFGLALALVFGGVLIALSAFPLALILAKGLAVLTSNWNPLYNPIVWELTILLRALAISLFAVVAGVLVPWRQLVKLEPVIVFKR